MCVCVCVCVLKLYLKFVCWNCTWNVCVCVCVLKLHLECACWNCVLDLEKMKIRKKTTIQTKKQQITTKKNLHFRRSPDIDEGKTERQKLERQLHQLKQRKKFGEIRWFNDHLATTPFFVLKSNLFNHMNVQVIFFCEKRFCFLVFPSRLFFLKLEMCVSTKCIWNVCDETVPEVCFCLCVLKLHLKWYVCVRAETETRNVCVLKSSQKL